MRRMHEPVGQFAVRGKKQQTCRVDIQPAHRNPSLALELGQSVENSWPALGILTRCNLALGLVIDKHASLGFENTVQADGLSVDFDRVARRQLRTKICRYTIDSDSTRLNQGLQLTAGTEPGSGQYFLETFRRLPLALARLGGVLWG